MRRKKVGLFKTKKILLDRNDTELSVGVGRGIRARGYSVHPFVGYMRTSILEDVMHVLSLWLSCNVSFTNFPTCVLCAV